MIFEEYLQTKLEKITIVCSNFHKPSVSECDKEKDKWTKTITSYLWY